MPRLVEIGLVVLEKMLKVYDNDGQRTNFDQVVQHFSHFLLTLYGMPFGSGAGTCMCYSSFPDYLYYTF